MPDVNTNIRLNSPIFQKVIFGTFSDGTLRALQCDDDGHLQVDIDAGAPALDVVNALDFTAFDLNAAAFSETSSVADDYILNSIKLNFSTTESKTITVTGPDGTILYKDTNTNQNVSLSDMNIAFNANENFTVDVTQFSSAGTMDCIAVIKKASSTLGGTPNVSIIAVADNPEVFEDTNFVVGDSPATLDANTTLGRNATQFQVWNDGTGNFTVATSTDGIAFGGEHTMKCGETYNINDISVDSIRITHVADSAYRVVIL